MIELPRFCCATAHWYAEPGGQNSQARNLSSGSIVGVVSDTASTISCNLSKVNTSWEFFFPSKSLFDNDFGKVSNCLFSSCFLKLIFCFQKIKRIRKTQRAGLILFFFNLKNTENTKLKKTSIVFKEHKNGVLCVFKNNFKKQEPNMP